MPRCKYRAETEIVLALLAELVECHVVENNRLNKALDYYNHFQLTGLCPVQPG